MGLQCERWVLHKRPLALRALGETPSTRIAGSRAPYPNVPRRGLKRACSLPVVHTGRRMHGLQGTGQSRARLYCMCVLVSADVPDSAACICCAQPCMLNGPWCPTRRKLGGLACCSATTDESCSSATAATRHNARMLCPFKTFVVSCCPAAAAGPGGRLWGACAAPLLYIRWYAQSQTVWE